MNEITESQIDRLFGEWDDLSQINYEPFKNNNFYAEFSNLTENENRKETVTINGFPKIQTPKKNKVLIYNPNISDPETQIPFYTMERESMTGQPICMYQQITPVKRNVQSTPAATDFQQDKEFLEWIDTVSVIHKPKPKPKSTIVSNKIPHRNIHEPMCIFIPDIHLIEFNDDDRFAEMTIFGQRFRLVTFYGRAFRIHAKELDKTMTYEVDDGMGKIKVTFKHLNNSFKSNHLSYNAVQMGVAHVKYGKRSKSNIAKNTVDDMQTLLKVVRKQAEASIEYFKSGSKVLVIGFPFKFHGHTEIRAVEMFDDSGFDRTNELYFKCNLAKLYEEKYYKYSVDNKLINR